MKNYIILYKMDMFSVSPQILSMRHVLGTCVVRTYLFPGLKKHRRTRSRLNGSFCNVYSDCCLYLPNGLKPCCLFFSPYRSLPTSSSNRDRDNRGHRQVQSLTLKVPFMVTEVCQVAMAPELWPRLTSQVPCLPAVRMTLPY